MEKWARREDERLLTGKGRYVADIRVTGCLDAAFVRSPVAHGVLREVDCTAARAVPGVAGAWSAADLPELPPVPNTLLAMLSTEEAVAGREWPALVKDRVRYPGEALAVVLGEDRYRAEDGVAEVTVTIDPLPAVVTPSAALEDEVRLFGGLSNVVLRGEAGEPVEESVWEDAAAVVEATYRQQLLIPSPMECRTILAVPEGDRLTVWSGHQMPDRLRRELAVLLGRSADRIRVVVPDTGGAFGSKSAAFPEFVTVAHLAVKLGRPVRWIEDRRESMLVATRGRGQDQTVRLAADADGRLLAYALSIDADVGAYPHLGAGLPMQTAWMAAGAYITPRIHATLRSVLTNTMMTYPYRGAGRPEAAIAIERSMDLLARRLGMDPVELRRRNFIPPDAFPYETPVGRVYDSGNYAAALDLALEALDHDRWRAEQARRRKDPDAFPLGIGVSCYVERSGGEAGGLHEFGSLQAGEDGKVTARCGAAPSGQGHETVFPALIAEFLGVAETQVRLVEGDTDEQPEGLGSFASRSAQIDGVLFRRLADLLIDEARTRAAGLWDLPVDSAGPRPDPRPGNRGHPGGTTRSQAPARTQSASPAERRCVAREVTASSARASPRARTRWTCSRSWAPMKAPRNMASTDRIRRPGRGAVPPAGAESAASPVRVSVSTVVVRSGTPSRRATAFCRPMASPRNTTSVYSTPVVTLPSPIAAAATATATRTACTAVAVFSRLPR